MYTLRTIAPNGAESNTLIGNHYRKVMRKNMNDEQFDKMFYDAFGEDAIASGLIGFVEGGNGTLYTVDSTQSYYVMLENGTTFSKLN